MIQEKKARIKNATVMNARSKNAPVINVPENAPVMNARSKIAPVVLEIMITYGITERGNTGFPVINVD